MRHCAFKKFGKGNETILFFPAAGFSGMEGEIIADFFQDDYQVYLCDTLGYVHCDKTAAHCSPGLT